MTRRRLRLMASVRAKAKKASEGDCQAPRMRRAIRLFLGRGPSDELIIQRAYRDTHEGRMPIDDGLDVISVGTLHKRFLDIATRLNRRAWVIIDNDGAEASEIEDRFAGYKGQQLARARPSESSTRRSRPRGQFSSPPTPTRTEPRSSGELSGLQASYQTTSPSLAGSLS